MWVLPFALPQALRVLPSVGCERPPSLLAARAANLFTEADDLPRGAVEAGEGHGGVRGRLCSSHTTSMQRL